MYITPKNVIKLAKEQLGTMESPAGSNIVKYSIEYGLPGQPWCMMFIWWLFKHTDSRLFMNDKKTASCTALMEWSQKDKSFTKYGKPGDIAIFDFSTKSVVKRHCGLMETFNDSIEGNTSATAKGSQDNGGIVARKTRKSANILGYVRPRYKYDFSIPTSTIKKGSKGYQVGLLQNFLNWFGFSLVCDNSFGANTLEAVKQFQKMEGLAVDGSVGPKTRARMEMVKNGNQLY